MAVTERWPVYTCRNVHYRPFWDLPCCYTNPADTLTQEVIFLVANTNITFPNNTLVTVTTAISDISCYSIHDYRKLDVPGVTFSGEIAFTIVHVHHFKGLLITHYHDYHRKCCKTSMYGFPTGVQGQSPLNTMVHGVNYGESPEGDKYIHSRANWSVLWQTGLFYASSSSQEGCVRSYTMDSYKMAACFV